MHLRTFIALALCVASWPLTAEVAVSSSHYAKYDLLPAPAAKGLVLRTGDRLAICGDSITEQKMYSRIIEDYLTMCVPELGIAVRQYGWSGERAPGFLNRMTNDCLRFKPTIATTCYGMNDHEYKPFEERIGNAYRQNSLAIIRAFKAHGVEVIHGSPGTVGKMPQWVKSAAGTVDDLNQNLSILRNIGVEIASQENVGFADVFWPMVTAGAKACSLYGTNYAIPGKDGVHPGWAGQAVMAYAFLKAFGLDGEIGTLTADLRKGRMSASPGHEVILARPGRFEIRSSRYPFCVCSDGQQRTGYPVCDPGELDDDGSIRSALTLIPFTEELNRFVLVARGGKARFYRVAWGSNAKIFSSRQLADGINLAEEFPSNPFTPAFLEVDAAIAAKQAFETRQVKQVFHGAEGKADMEAAVVRTEAERDKLASSISRAFRPVTHVIEIEEVVPR